MSSSFQNSFYKIVPSSAVKEEEISLVVVVVVVSSCELMLRDELVIEYILNMS